MKNLILDEDRHNEAYAMMLDRMGRCEWFRDWADKIFPTVILQKLAPNLGDEDGTFCSLGVGTGNGEFELHLLKQLSTRFPRIKHVVIEPSKDFIQSYQATVATSSFKGSIHFEWHEGTFQDYKEKTLQRGASLDGQFNFISAIHSLYYVDNAREALEFLYRSLSPGGVFMIEMSADKSSGQGLWEGFPELLQMFTLHKWLSNSDITGALSDMNVPFSRLVNPIPVDMTGLFDETSHEGNLLLDFLTHVSYFRKTADQDLVKRVLEFLKMNTEDQKVVPMEKAGTTVNLSDDKKLSTGLSFKKIWDMMIIEKN